MHPLLYHLSMGIHAKVTGIELVIGYGKREKERCKEGRAMCSRWHGGISGSGDVSAGDVDAVERKEGRGGMPCSCQKALEAVLRKLRHLPFNEIGRSGRCSFVLVVLFMMVEGVMDYP